MATNRDSVHLQTFARHPRKSNLLDLNPSSDLPDVAGDHDEKNHSVEFQQLWNDNKYNRGPLVSLVILRILLCIGLVMLPVARLLNAALGIMLAVASAVIVLMIFSKRLKRQSILMERHFFSNLVAREVEQERKAPINQRFANHLLERDLHLADFEVKQNSPSMGKA